jgi:hypothetical protein
LLAVADDPITRYAAPEIKPAELRVTAAGLRFPKAAAMATAYSQLADRAQGNAAKIAEAVRAAVHTASSGVNQSKLALLRRAARSTRH